MNKTVIRIFAAILCLLMLLSLCASVFADEENAADASADPLETVDAAPAEEESNGIIDGASLKAIIDDYVKENGLSGNNKVFSIAYCYTATGDTWYYDADQWCYSASLYKVPCCMLLAEKEYNGEITSETQISSQYANGTVDHMEQRSIVYSDNYTGHAVVEYLGGTYSGKCAEQTVKFTDLPEDYFPEDFAAYSYYSAKYYNQILTTLFSQSDKFPRIMDYMKQDQAYHYLDLQLNGAYETAQKYGAFEEKNGNKNYHSAGIIYTPNPIIVTIMTKNITGFEKHIGNVAKILVDYTLQLDSELSTYKANLLIAQQEEQARLAREEQERLAAEAQAQQAAAQAAQSQQTAQTQPVPQTQQSSGALFIDTPQQTVTPAAEDGILGLLSSAPSFTLPIVIGLAVLALIFLIVFIVKLRKVRLEEDEYDDDDYEEYMRGDLSELAPKQDRKKVKNKKNKKSEEYYDDYADDYGEYDGYDEYDSGRSGRKSSRRDPEPVYEEYEEYEDDGAYADDSYAGRPSDERFSDDAGYADQQYADDGYADETYGDSGYYDDAAEEDRGDPDAAYDDGAYADYGYYDSRSGDSRYSEEQTDDYAEETYGNEKDPDYGASEENYADDEEYDAPRSSRSVRTSAGRTSQTKASSREKTPDGGSRRGGKISLREELSSVKPELLKNVFKRKKAQAVEYEPEESFDDDPFRDSYNSSRSSADYSEISEEDYSRYGLGKADEGYGSGSEYDDSEFNLSDYDYSFDYNDDERDSAGDDYLKDFDSESYRPRH